MNKHATETTKGRPKGELRVLDGNHRSAATETLLREYDASSLVGLRTIVRDAAIQRTDKEGEITVELPKLRELLAAAAVKRALLPIRLRGHEIKAMRRIMKLTLAELAKRLDERTAAETVSRWESEAQPMGGYAEKLLRLLVCEALREEAPGIEYNASMIANMKVSDPWRSNADYEVPSIDLWLIRIKEQSGAIIEAWDAKMAA